MDSPQINPRAAQWLEISGRIAERYDLRVTAHYAVSNRDCGYSELMLLERLAVERSAERYATRARLDKWQPGRCGWFFQEVVFDLWPRGTENSQAPGWQWKEWIGPQFRWSSIEHTIECGVRKTPSNGGSCESTEGGYVGPPPGVAPPMRRLVVNFQ